ncbi:carboxymuconolactone decarboxylase family protein [Aestuariicella hydrocarbonica]|uniref:Carboxymuconolactone decarboxylase family protein n=1 Tax=Pseudomaricurvus hydrocarbonicus TaxID=1470433 RepID=A0A9E5MM11_9GAMM|nr:carboxymuconolactone decarboxylase family protein [Aestuariicella hydrocarbonica]NHO65993.1 carboxymuconolactone decarboxylase family protein [Aestuariicella hydrocarbonica]
MNTPESIQAREDDILGKPPRISPQHTAEEMTAARNQLAKIIGVASGDDVPMADAEVPHMLLTAMCHEQLFDKVSDVSVFLLNNPSLELRDRQLVILRVGWLCQIPYIWGEHVQVSKRVGLTSEDIEAVTAGSSSPYWNRYERALLKAAEELQTNAMISDDTWATLAERLSEKQLFELIVLVGQFATVGYFQNALRLKLSPTNAGLMAR